MGGRGSSSSMSGGGASPSGSRSENNFSNRSVYDSVRSTLERGEAPTKRMTANAGVGSEIAIEDTTSISYQIRGGTPNVITYTKINNRQWQLTPTHQPKADRYSNSNVAAHLYYAFTGKYDTTDDVKRINLK